MTFRAGLAASLSLAVLAAPLAAQDSETPRVLDGVPSDIRAYTGKLDDGAAVFSVGVDGGTSVQVDAVPAPLSEIDPMLIVRDEASGEVLAENDDGGDGLAARVRVFSNESRRLLIEVSTFDDSASGGAFELYIRSSDYRPVEPRQIAFESRETGTLAGGEGHQFLFTGSEGTLLEVSMTADGEDSALDPYLEVFEGRGAEGEALASDDDSGGETDALLRFVLPADGTYTVLARDFADAGGAYVLRVAEEKERVVQPPAQQIGIGQTLTGRLGDGYGGATGDPEMISYRLDAEAVTAIRAGRGKLTFEMQRVEGEDEDFASSVDPMLELGFETPLGFVVAESDDDGGEGLNARLPIDLAPLAGDGDWLDRLVIHATSLGDETGAYSITLRKGLLDPVADEDDAEAQAEAMED